MPSESNDQAGWRADEVHADEVRADEVPADVQAAEDLYRANSEAAAAQRVIDDEVAGRVPEPEPAAVEVTPTEVPPEVQAAEDLYWANSEAAATQRAADLAQYVEFPLAVIESTNPPEPPPPEEDSFQAPADPFKAT